MEVRAVEVQSSESCGGANYQKTWVTIESVVVCFGANTFHWLNVCLVFEGFWTKATNKRFCSSLVQWVKSVATNLTEWPSGVDEWFSSTLLKAW